MADHSAAKICLALAEAFVDDPFHHAAAADVRQQVLADYFHLAIDEARGIGKIHFARDDGASICYTDVALTAAASAFTAVREQALRRLLGPLGFAHCLDISEGMSAQAPDTLESAWYLSILGVRAAAPATVSHTICLFPPCGVPIRSLQPPIWRSSVR